MLSVFPHYRDAPSLISTRWPPLDLLQHVDVLPVLGIPELEGALQVGSHLDQHAQAKVDTGKAAMGV